MIDKAEVEKLVTALRLIFWGLIIVLIDINVQSFDLVNDIVGILVIASAIKLLTALHQNGAYRRVMRFARMVAFLACFDSLYNQFFEDAVASITVASAALELVTAFAIVMFCHAMRWLSREHGLWRAAMSWHKTAKLATWLYLVTTGAFLTCGSLFRMLDHSDNTQITSFILFTVFFVMMVAPFVHFMISLTRMKREAILASGKQKGADTDYKISLSSPPLTDIDFREELKTTWFALGISILCGLNLITNWPSSAGIKVPNAQ